MLFGRMRLVMTTFIGGGGDGVLVAFKAEIDAPRRSIRMAPPAIDTIRRMRGHHR